MFFVLSKTVGAMLLPSNFLIGLAVVGALLLATRKASLGRKLMVTSVVLLAICGFSPLGSWLLYPLESRFPPWNPAQGAPDGIIVLGGSIDAALSAAHGTPVVHSDADRVIAAVELARQYPNARLIFSGGSARVIFNEAREADYAGTLFESLGIPAARLTLERRSRNTLENAEFCKEIASPKPGQRWLLVTSAYHMPRAVGLFRKVGFDVEPYPVDWRVGGHADLFAFTDMAHEGWRRTDVAVREWTGLLAYWATGKIDHLFPGPADPAVAPSGQSG